MQQDDMILQEILQMKGELSQIKGIVTNGLSSKVVAIDNKLSAFLETRAETCPVVIRKRHDVTNSRLYVAIIALIVGIVSGLPAWIGLLKGG
jgi:hypothetical protein